MNKNEATAIAKSLFANHTVDKFFVAKDGQAFFSETDANNHQLGLTKDEKVIAVTREDAEAFEPEAEVIVGTEEKTTSEKKEKKAPASKKDPADKK